MCDYDDVTYIHQPFWHKFTACSSNTFSSTSNVTNFFRARKHNRVVFHYKRLKRVDASWSVHWWNDTSKNKKAEFWAFFFFMHVYSPVSVFSIVSSRSRGRFLKTCRFRFCNSVHSSHGSYNPSANIRLKTAWRYRNIVTTVWWIIKGKCFVLFSVPEAWSLIAIVLQAKLRIKLGFVLAIWQTWYDSLYVPQEVLASKGQVLFIKPTNIHQNSTSPQEQFPSYGRIGMTFLYSFWAINIFVTT